MKDIRRLTGFHPATIYRKIKLNEFPAPIKIGSASRWPEEVFTEWRGRAIAGNSE
ncbi:helix-turn-helix transcriptional regulator [Chromobacterium vaccinii]